MVKRLGRGNLLLVLHLGQAREQIRILARNVGSGANIGISEAFVFLSAPWFFLKDFRTLCYDGFMAALWLVIATLISCLISAQVNHIEFVRLFRGFSTAYSLFAWIVVLHRLLRNNLNGLKWLLLGLALSMTINIFAFQTGQGADGSVNGVYGDATEITTSSAIFWISRIGQWGPLPIKGWYLQTPFAYSCLFPLFMIAFSMLTTESGRSAAISALGSVVLIFMGRKSVRSMKRISRNIILLAGVGVVTIFVFKEAYRYGAMNGYLGEKAQRKYEAQTKGKKGVLALLMGGRAEAFIGLIACLDNPLFGCGSWALDYNHYSEEFLMKYGDDEDYAKFLEERVRMAQSGRSEVVSIIPAHSHVVSFWLWYGLPGLLFWLYVLYLMCQCIARYLHVIPQWFGFLALSLSGMGWTIFFSGFGQRFSDSLFVVALLLVRAVARGCIKLPPEMIVEIQMAERKADNFA